MAIAKHLRRYIRAFQYCHTVDIEQQSHNSHYDTEPNQRTVESVIIFTVDTNKNNCKKKYAPQSTAKPVDSVERFFGKQPNGAGQRKDQKPNNALQPNDKPVHILPVGPIADMYGHQSGKLDTFKDDNIDHRIKDRKVSGGRDTQSHVGKALERSPHTENSRHKTDRHQQIDIARRHRDQVAGNQDRTNRK